MVLFGCGTGPSFGCDSAPSKIESHCHKAAGADRCYRDPAGTEPSERDCNNRIILLLFLLHLRK